MDTRAHRRGFVPILVVRTLFAACLAAAAVAWVGASDPGPVGDRLEKAAGGLERPVVAQAVPQGGIDVSGAIARLRSSGPMLRLAQRGVETGRIPTIFDLGVTIFPEMLPNRIYLGTDNRDTLFGGGGNDILFAFGAADRLNGGLGNDIAVGGAGDDFMVGNNGADMLVGETGDDYIDGNNGPDIILAGGGVDEIQALAGDDFIDCGAGSDDLNAGLGNDICIGGIGNDFLWGRWLDDRIEGGRGNDTIHAASGINDLYGGPGFDRFFYDVFDARDNGAIDVIHDFEKGSDLLEVNREVRGSIRRIEDEEGRRTELVLRDPSGDNVRQIAILGVWINPADVIVY